MAGRKIFLMLMETKYTWIPEIWGGVECTINRIDDQFRDQLGLCGHYDRPGDIGTFGELGLKKLRYPILWEYHQREEHALIDWTWTSQRLAEISAAGIEPIAGLVHHGSGPAFTSLLDDGFAEKLAVFAGKVAEQFPWINYYTPVNEPLTTARFSSLYGFWYPHHRSEKSFTRALINQVKGIVLSMQAIRKINPDAKLVQTEDLTRIHSTSTLTYQADYENERRWLSYDLLCGKVNRQHYFWKRLLAEGIAEKELQFFVDNPCPPDIMGFNYYVTSERFLDDDIEKYPLHLHGGNGRHVYADTEAVRAHRCVGLPVLLQEAWDRFHLPVAITECHLSCSRDEQMRWFKQTWEHCRQAKQAGIDVRAITAWALLGACDWDSLLVRNNGNYEPGVFDTRGKQIRPTALAQMLRSLAKDGDYEHPVLERQGWWQHNAQVANNNAMKPIKKILIVGRNGTLGQALMRICDHRAIDYVALSKQELDISNNDQIVQAVEHYQPWAIINASGYVRVDDAEVNSNECFAINATGPGLLAAVCQRYGIQLMTFSSDLVFDGGKKEPYHEFDDVNPLNVYGNSKAAGEKNTLTAFPESLIIRTSAFFGPWDRYNFVFQVIESLKNGRTLEVPSDVIVSPTYVPDLANASLDLLIDNEKGIWHLTNEGKMSWADFGHEIAARTGSKKDMIRSLPLDTLGWKANRPLYSVLQSEKGLKLPTLDSALVRYFEQQEV